MREERHVRSARRRRERGFTLVRGGERGESGDRGSGPQPQRRDISITSTLNSSRIDRRCWPFDDRFEVLVDSAPWLQRRTQPIAGRLWRSSQLRFTD
jgi:hypothetical protein